MFVINFYKGVSNNELCFVSVYTVETNTVLNKCGKSADGCYMLCKKNKILLSENISGLLFVVVKRRFDSDSEHKQFFLLGERLSIKSSKPTEIILTGLKYKLYENILPASSKCYISICKADTPISGLSKSILCDKKRECIRCEENCSFSGLEMTTNYILYIKINSLIKNIIYKRMIPFRTSYDVLLKTLVTTNVVKYVQYNVQLTNVGNDRKKCRLYIKTKDDSYYSHAICDNKQICERKCSELFTVTNLALGTSYNIIIEPLSGNFFHTFNITTRMENLTLSYNLNGVANVRVVGKVKNQQHAIFCFFSLYEKIQNSKTIRTWCHNMDCAKNSCVVDINGLEFSKSYSVTMWIVHISKKKSIDFSYNSNNHSNTYFDLKYKNNNRNELFDDVIKKIENTPNQQQNININSQMNTYMTNSIILVFTMSVVIALAIILIFIYKKNMKRKLEI